ncbi:unnamed protein product [Oncorhynchus mykiss]|uniref:Uncharacterized protein n=1 Tax=Oncorhynchus mykiss TaxID=8022 RepID=A0A060ZA26_ONCMY|nr:unnamed protein product [Oncorhynchus mykiss]
MDMSTTSGSVYVQHNIQPFISAKPFNRPTKSSAPFQVGMRRYRHSESIQTS